MVVSWSLELPKTPGFGRSNHAFHHEIHQVPGVLILDDSVSCTIFQPEQGRSLRADWISNHQLQDFNTQKSSQWDGLRHFAYQKEQLFYNRTSPEKVLSGDSGSLGIQNWSNAGGIAGRGVLLDYWSWGEENGKFGDMSTNTPIMYDDLMRCYHDQQARSIRPLELRSGDILLVRSGFTKAYLGLGADTEKAIGSAFPMKAAGVHQDKRLLEWLWTNQVAAVGGDAQGWECLPADESAGCLFHEVLLAGWGCPISELLYLEDLAAACKENRQWTFLLTSSPLNVFGGVASPANMMAIL